ncbi:MAG: hypothetical protein U0165_03330 [Polyangiaceae bacterium]
MAQALAENGASALLCAAMVRLSQRQLMALLLVAAAAVGAAYFVSPEVLKAVIALAVVVAFFAGSMGAGPSVDLPALVDAIRRAQGGDRPRAPADADPELLRVYEMLADVAEGSGVDPKQLEEAKVTARREAEKEGEVAVRKLEDERTRLERDLDDARRKLEDEAEAESNARWIWSRVGSKTSAHGSNEKWTSFAAEWKTNEAEPSATSTWRPVEPKRPSVVRSMSESEPSERSTPSRTRLKPRWGVFQRRHESSSPAAQKRRASPRDVSLTQ